MSFIISVRKRVALSTVLILLNLPISSIESKRDLPTDYRGLQKVENTSDLEYALEIFNNGVLEYQNGSFERSYKYLNKSINLFENLKNKDYESLLNAYLWGGAAAF